MFWARFTRWVSAIAEVPSVRIDVARTRVGELHREGGLAGH